ncbi:MFS transporter [Agromyces endophyticus]|uniref:MFS transporter n=1 Tax=Agromyces sp. H17E-10 TaxID=2932244 RepID=UPI001FD0B801|nr:MFS transporter [Agromyces sp. H17E-10]UOQ88107.1 MFS transporter [Agromyces sp. H17E-10]
MPLGLIALAIGGFGIGLTEFVIMGLLPEVAADFGVSESAAGWFISGYALAVVVGALGLTAATTRLPRKPVLMGLLVLFIAGNAISAMAPSYELMMTGRIIAALCHGAFFGIGSVVAASLVAPERAAGAIAIMFTGLTAANVLGVPFGTFIGQQYGWRATFWAISVIGVIALIGIAVLVPSLRTVGATGGAGSPAAPSLRRELGAFRSGQVWLSLVVTVLGFGGMFGAFTYIAYTLTEVSGFAAGTVPWLLVLFGAGLVVGNWAGGRLADRSIDGTLLAFIGALVVVLALFAWLAFSPVATIVLLVLMGAFGFGTVPGLQSRIMRYASDAPTLASGANIAAFNLGNALGAWAGGLTIAAGLGFTSPIWVGAGITLAALVVMAVATATARRTAVAESTKADASAPTRPTTAPTPVAAH